MTTDVVTQARLQALRPGSRVLISGAGPGGAALASALTAAGVAVDLIEQRSGFSPADGAGILLPGNATAMLDRLGRLDAIRAAAREIPGVQLASPDGRELGRVPCNELRYPAFGMRYARLREILLGDMPVSFGLSIESLQENERVEVGLSDGSVRHYDLVMGADGVHSGLRALCFDPRPADVMTQYSGYRFVVDSDLGLDTATTYLGDGLTLLFVPLPGQQTYCGAGPVHTDRLIAGATPAETIAATYHEVSEGGASLAGL